jgi:ATP phosphoribosyltransferase
VRTDPNLPRGVQAFLFESAERRRGAEESVVSVLRQAGISEVILPVLDHARPYEGVTAEGDERVYRFVDRRGELLGLRADFTPMAARVLAPRLAGLSLPVSVFYRGDVVRDEPAGVGRAREFAQVGAERYGDPSPRADEEMLELLLACLEGIPSERLTLTLGFAGLLPALLTAMAPALTRGNGSALAVTLVDARLRRVGAVEDALTGAGAPKGPASEIARALLAGFDPGSALFRLPVLQEGAVALARAEAAARRVRPDLPVVFDLAGTPETPYYTGITFRLDARGGTVPVAGGGRYDALLARFGAPAAAIGFSIGVEALASALETAAETGPRVERPLRIAVGKGRLLEKALPLLRAAGAEFPEPDGRRLVVADASGAFELLLLKDDDVPTYVAHGGADMGVVGADRVEESGEEVHRPLDLPFGECRLALIGRAGEEFRPNGHPVTVGTKYRRLAARFFDERGIAHEIVPLAGSVELAAALKLTDVVVDLIETGSTIAANGLAEIETILPSRATLLVGPAALAARRQEIARFVERLRSAVEARC